MTDAVFVAAVPEALRARATGWTQGAPDDDDEVGALWSRIRRGALIGAGFGRDLFELRADPAAPWVAAYALLAGQDPVTTQLTTRAMFARFGGALIAPLAQLGARVPVRERGALARALHAAAGDQGTPEALQRQLIGLAGSLAEGPAPEDPDVRALWRQASADPADPLPRFVLADLYAERGDPRGGFMADSLRALGTGRRPVGEAALLRQHEDAWLGAFGALARAPRRWAGGVVVACGVSDTLALQQALPEWRFVEELHLWRGWLLSGLAPERFPSLRVLGGLAPDDLPELARHPIAAQLTRVHVDGPLLEPGVLGALAPRVAVVVHGPRPLPESFPEVTAERAPYGIRQLPAGRRQRAS